MKTDKTFGTGTGRRSFLKKTSYLAPAIITMTALPSFASSGSGYQPEDKDNDQSEEIQPVSLLTKEQEEQKANLENKYEAMRLAQRQARLDELRKDRGRN